MLKVIGRKQLIAASSQFPESSDVWYTRARMLRDRKRLPEALVSADRAIKLAPLKGEYHRCKAQILLELGKAKEADR